MSTSLSKPQSSARGVAPFALQTLQVLSNTFLRIRDLGASFFAPNIIKLVLGKEVSTLYPTVAPGVAQFDPRATLMLSPKTS